MVGDVRAAVLKDDVADQPERPRRRDQERGGQTHCRWPAVPQVPAQPLPGGLRTWLGPEGGDGRRCCCDEGERGQGRRGRRRREQGRRERALLGRVLRCREGQAPRSRSHQVYRRAVQATDAYGAYHARVYQEALGQRREPRGGGDRELVQAPYDSGQYYRYGEGPCTYGCVLLADEGALEEQERQLAYDVHVDRMFISLFRPDLVADKLFIGCY